MCECVCGGYDFPTRMCLSYDNKLNASHTPSHPHSAPPSSSPPSSPSSPPSSSKHLLTPVKDVSFEVQCVLASCHSLALLEGELVGDPLEKAALAAIDWSLAKSMSSITQAGGGGAGGAVLVLGCLQRGCLVWKYIIIAGKWTVFVCVRRVEVEKYDG